MTSEEIKAAIHRVGNTMGHTIDEVIEALCNRPVNGCVLRGKLIELLRQADPDTHMELPVDADGVPIHVGDELCGHYYPDGGMYCWSISGSEIIFVNKVGEHYKDAMLWNPSDCRHYHKPTVEELLDELEGLRGTGDYEAVVTRAAELAGMLRKVIDGD